MVSINKKTVKNQTYYYLEHTYRSDGKVQKREKYLGKKLPQNIEQLKKEFLAEIYKEKWYPQFEGIRANCAKEARLTPVSAKQKEMSGFSVRFTYDTNRIEGSRLTFKETSDLLERGITPNAKPFHDIIEAESHRKVFYEMLNYKNELSLQEVLFWHKKLFEATKPDFAGKIRQHQVAISRSKFMPPLPVEVYPLLREFFSWYAKKKAALHPVELAALVHLKFVTIHPFADGNGRVSRLMMNFVLQKHRFPMLNIRYVNRNSYYNALERAQIKKQESIFVQWLFRRYVKEYGSYLKYVTYK